MANSLKKKATAVTHRSQISRRARRGPFPRRRGRFPGCFPAVEKRREGKLPPWKTVGHNCPFDKFSRRIFAARELARARLPPLARNAKARLFLKYRRPSINNVPRYVPDVPELLPDSLPAAFKLFCGDLTIFRSISVLSLRRLSVETY